MTYSSSPKRRRNGSERKEHNAKPICIPAGRKIRFGDRKRALTALNIARSIESAQTKPEAVYQCPFCKDWHMTKRVRADGKTS